MTVAPALGLRTLLEIAEMSRGECVRITEIPSSDRLEVSVFEDDMLRLGQVRAPAAYPGD